MNSSMLSLYWNCLSKPLCYDVTLNEIGCVQLKELYTIVFSFFAIFDASPNCCFNLFLTILSHSSRLSFALQLMKTILSFQFSCICLLYSSSVILKEVKSSIFSFNASLIHIPLEANNRTPFSVM